ncbi:TPR-like protein [Peniophora sp. CONT]|nr:TPR-like protein [Peniophora sp. CONT]
MSAAFVKGKLKLARDALSKKDYETARDAAASVLEYEGANYNAKVFLGLAQSELGDAAGSEATYKEAIALNGTQPLAHQGLAKVYEKGEKWEEYASALEGLAKLFRDAGDATKCAENVQKLVELRRNRGTPTQVADAIALYLPSSPFYAVLSTLPTPDHTAPTATTTYAAQCAVHATLPILEEITDIYEREEDNLVKREVESRRKRLGAKGPEEIKREVGREVYGTSKLPGLYDELLNHPALPDDTRRLIESKLLRHKRAHLHALSSTDPLKASLAKDVQALVDGAVLLGIEDEVAWEIWIEGRDAATIEDYDLPTLRRYITLFPGSSRAKLVRAYMIYTGAWVEEEEEKDDEGYEGPVPDEEGEEPLDIMLDSFNSLSGSILAHRILSEVYLWEVDYTSTIAVAEVGLELVRAHTKDTGISLELVQKAFNVALATALVHHFPPKHHARALRILDDVLSVDPANVPCLMGRGYIMQRKGDWEEAAKMFGCVPDEHDEGVRAREEEAWCAVQLGRLDEGVVGLESVLAQLEDLEGKDEDRARCLYRLGHAHWEMGEEHRETAYKQYIKSLKEFPSFAPSFTALGIYYLSTSPPDPGRASRCFQKAFELDAREGEAARRLAEGFADEREWDLVEVVARRTIEGEGGAEVDANEIAASRYAPTNAWAWKAMGVVHLNRRDFPPAIQAFQVALRATSEDALCWLRLGEAYAAAGRHVAALKALNRAKELAPDDWVCAFQIGDVQRQMGQFFEALTSFGTILEVRPGEPGVLVALAQTHLDLGREQATTGFLARAEDSFVRAVGVALEFIASDVGFRGVAWKTVADALFLLSKRTSCEDPDNVRDALDAVVPLITLDKGSRLAEILPLPVTSPAAEESIRGVDTLKIALAVYDYRLTLGFSDSSATASAWYDFAMALHVYENATVLPEDKKTVVHKRAVGAAMEAVRADPREPRHWRAFGDLSFVAQPRSAQHAYVRALELDGKDVQTWASLGLLYLHHGDTPLANEAFYRAQTLDPDYALAWVGQGLVATQNGHFADSRVLFEHAVSLTADVPDADLEFARREFKHHASASADSLFPAFFVLGRYCQQRPDDSAALHLYALISERVGHLSLAAELAGRAIAVLEVAYEESEDATIERQFAIANTTMARVQLASGAYQAALEYYESAAGILGEEEVGPLKVQSHFGTGLANFKLGQLQEAVGAFEDALAAAGEDSVIKGHVTVLLAQTLWAMGSQEAQESAKAQLLECITTDPENLTAINALAGMGILTEDEGLVDAALSEILALPLDQRRARDPRRDVTYLLTQQQLEQNNVAGARAEAQRAVHSEPANAAVRHSLATLVMQTGEISAAQAILASGADTDMNEQRDALALRSVAEADADLALSLKAAQRAVMLAPWELKNWEALAYIRSKSV